MKKFAYVNALRELADFVESKEFPDEWTPEYSWSTNQTSWEPPYLLIRTKKKEEFENFCRQLGGFKKDFNDFSSSAIKELLTGAKITISTDRRNVCKRTVVGTRIISAKEERTEIYEAEPEREEEIVKWECESFLGDSNETV